MDRHSGYKESWLGREVSGGGVFAVLRRLSGGWGWVRGAAERLLAVADSGCGASSRLVDSRVEAGSVKEYGACIKKYRSSVQRFTFVD